LLAALTAPGICARFLARDGYLSSAPSQRSALFFRVMDVSANTSTPLFAVITTVVNRPQGWWLEQPEPGVLQWRTPAGRTPTVYPT